MVHVEHGTRHHQSRSSTNEARAAQLKRRKVPQSGMDLLVQPEAIRTFSQSKSVEHAKPEDLIETRKGASQQSGTIKPSSARRVA